LLGPKKKYRVNLPTPEDTTIRGGDLLTPGFLRLVGELLFGSLWQTPLAQRLGEVRGKPLSPATVHRWTTESRSIPDWVAAALTDVLEQATFDLDRRARTAGEIAMRMKAPGTAGGEFEPHSTDLPRSAQVG
jgi:hypothetical protein